jgi:hypothetical protein
VDLKNRFHTAETYRWMRLDYTILLAVLLGLAAVHWREIRWIPFIVAFSWIDLVGYIPGAIWYRRHGEGERRRIPATFHHLYNFTHSMGVNALLLGIWYLAVGGWEWAMLAAPIHLAGDRGLFGNVYKPVDLAFEPVLHPAFEAFTKRLEAMGRW